MRRWLLVIPALVVVALVAAIASSSTGGGGSRHATVTLPAVGTAIPTDYRVVYEVTTPDGTTTEEHIVHRPFGAAVIQRDGHGAITAERWSALGELVTRSAGAKAVSVSTAIAPSASDARPDLFADDLVKVGRMTAGAPGEVGGRACTRASQPQNVVTQGGATAASGKNGSLPVKVTSCSDRQGIVLEERWASAGGTTLLTKRAIELQLGSDVPAIRIPSADPLSAAQGNGAVRKLASNEAVPFPETFHLVAPKGFTFVGRYAVVPVRLAQGGAAVPAQPGVALYTDVWRRGPDLLLLDQGATTTGSAPFDAKSALGPVEVPGVGTATLAVDLQLAEVRFIRPHGGFARLAGTIDPKDLVTIADTLTVAPSPR